MHETHLFKHLLTYLKKEEEERGKALVKVYVSLSVLGGLSSEHFLAHFGDVARGTPWESLEFEFSHVAYGSEFEITRLDFTNQRRG
jgi:Zn finger protein HypA/HybF involved in hydrogenase expression